MVMMTVKLMMTMLLVVVVVGGNVIMIIKCQVRLRYDDVWFCGGDINWQKCSMVSGGYNPMMLQSFLCVMALGCRL